MPYYYSEVRTRVNTILQSEYEKAIRIIENNRAAIDALCEALLERNHLGEAQIDEIFRRTVTQ
jgi:ATP-dependent Zn protease